MNWARSLSSKCWTVIAMRASTLAATRRLAGFGLEAWRAVTSKWMGGSLSFSEALHMLAIIAPHAPLWGRALETAQTPLQWNGRGRYED
eukprot:scaffold1130_cov127-Isochrysis_galbana.AAC.7